MKLLSIGNSFSMQPHFYLEKLAAAQGKDFMCRNLFIPGCPLEKHYNNFMNKEAAYQYQIYGAKNDNMISIQDAVAHEDWDIITLQQAARFSGMKETFEPYLETLINYIKENKPNAEIILHQTWAFETDTVSPQFENYSNSQKEMYERIVETFKYYSEKYGLRVIESGRAIQLIRESLPEFDYKNGGISLNAEDGRHLCAPLGCYVATCAWYKALFGDEIRGLFFPPKMYEDETGETIKLAIKVNEVMNKLF